MHIFHDGLTPKLLNSLIANNAQNDNCDHRKIQATGVSFSYLSYPVVNFVKQLKFGWV